MDTSQFEGVKVALKQDKTGYVLTLCIHPDEIPEDIVRDFVGARYQVVMVRLNEDQTPYPRRNGVVSAAGILCRDAMFWDWLMENGEVEEKSESAAVEALHRLVGINTRKELADQKNQDAFDSMVTEFKAWRADAPPF